MAVRIVVHYQDGRLLKGFSNDFFPKKPNFHIGSNPAERGDEINVADLKAIFFVKDFEGTPGKERKKSFDDGQVVQGRKVKITFKDGEVMVGSVLGYDPDRIGFFLMPCDPNDNNERVFIVSAAMESIEND